MPDKTTVSDNIFIVSDLFSSKECSALIDFAESVGFTDAPINTAVGPQVHSDVRNNTRAMVDDLTFAEALWERSKAWVPERLGNWEAIGVNERFRFYRYEIGQQFNWHRDGHFRRDNGDLSRLTFMIYLNDDFLGGHTLFNDADIAPETGAGLFFAHELRHKGQKVSEGRKYVMRTDVIFRLNRVDE